MEKITDKQVKKVEVIYDCSEFSSDTYTVEGYSATFYAERWDDNRRSGESIKCFNKNSKEKRWQILTSV